MEHWKNRLWTMPLALLAGGIVMRGLTFFVVKLLMGASKEWTLEMGRQSALVLGFLALLILAGTAVLLRRLCLRPVLWKSAWIMVAYNFIVLALEQLSQHFDFFGFTLVYYLYLPQEAFNSLRSALLSALPAGPDWLLWATAIVSQLLPLIFIPVGRKPHPISLEKRS